MNLCVMYAQVDVMLHCMKYYVDRCVRFPIGYFYCVTNKFQIMYPFSLLDSQFLNKLCNVNILNLLWDSGSVIPIDVHILTSLKGNDNVYRN